MSRGKKRGKARTSPAKVYEDRLAEQKQNRQELLKKLSPAARRLAEKEFRSLGLDY